MLSRITLLYTSKFLSKKNIPVEIEIKIKIKKEKRIVLIFFCPIIEVFIQSPLFFLACNNARENKIPVDDKLFYCLLFPVFLRFLEKDNHGFEENRKNLGNGFPGFIWCVHTCLPKFFIENSEFYPME